MSAVITRVDQYPDVEPASTGMALTDFWKQRSIEVMSRIFPKNLDQVVEFVEKKAAKAKSPKVLMRDLYRFKEPWEYDLNDMLKITKEKELIMGANGAYTVRQHIHKSEVSEYTDYKLARRAAIKAKMFEYKEAGDEVAARKADNGQTNEKEDANSVYGVTIVNGYCLNSPDSASMTTSQGRETIATGVWTFEKLLEDNLTFTNVNEFYLYTEDVINIPIEDADFIKYDLKIPTDDMLLARLQKMVRSDIPENEQTYFTTEFALTSIVESLKDDPKGRFNLYYRNNLYVFLDDHKIIKDKFDDVMAMGLKFLSPLKKDMLSTKKKDAEKAEAGPYVPILDELTYVFINLLLAPIQTSDRVEKYKFRGRASIVVSDTDSAVINLDPWVNYMAKSVNPFDVANDEPAVFRIVNALSYIITDVANFMLSDMCRHCHVPLDVRHRINLKNEFFFKSLIVYPHSKKNYSALVRLREGVLVNELANTGSALSSKNINPLVKSTFNHILEEEIHGTYNVSASRILTRVQQLESGIRHHILVDRDLEFGTFTAYKTSGIDMPYRNSTVRAVELWNRNYPDEKIEPYNKVYVYNTILEKESQLHLIKDPQWRAKIKKLIFDEPINEFYPNYGLRTIAIPDTFGKYPEWLASIVNVNKIVEKHLTPITAILPALGIYKNRVTSGRSQLSNLIDL